MTRQHDTAHHHIHSKRESYYVVMTPTCARNTGGLCSGSQEKDMGRAIFKRKDFSEGERDDFSVEWQRGEKKRAFQHHHWRRMVLFPTLIVI